MAKGEKMKSKKLGILLILFMWSVSLVISFFAGMMYNRESVVDIKTTKDYSQKVVEENNEYIVEIPIFDIETIVNEQEGAITRDEAEKLCREVLEDKAEENGFPISYKAIGAIFIKEKIYYVMHISWLVNNNHWSYIGNCYVSIDGQEIYDGVRTPSKHEITTLRWKR